MYKEKIQSLKKLASEIFSDYALFPRAELAPKQEGCISISQNGTLSKADRFILSKSQKILSETFTEDNNPVSFSEDITETEITDNPEMTTEDSSFSEEPSEVADLLSEEPLFGDETPQSAATEETIQDMHDILESHDEGAITDANAIAAIGQDLIQLGLEQVNASEIATQIATEEQGVEFEEEAFLESSVRGTSRRFLRQSAEFDAKYFFPPEIREKYRYQFVEVQSTSGETAIFPSDAWASEYAVKDGSPDKHYSLSDFREEFGENPKILQSFPTRLPSNLRGSLEGLTPPLTGTSNRLEYISDAGKISVFVKDGTHNIVVYTYINKKGSKKEFPDSQVLEILEYVKTLLSSLSPIQKEKDSQWNHLDLQNFLAAHNIKIIPKKYSTWNDAQTAFVVGNGYYLSQKDFISIMDDLDSSVFQEDDPDGKGIFLTTYDLPSELEEDHPDSETALTSKAFIKSSFVIRDSQDQRVVSSPYEDEEEAKRDVEELNKSEPGRYIVSTLSQDKE